MPPCTVANHHARDGGVSAQKSKHKKEKKHKREAEGERSIITGKRIKRSAGDVADAEGELRRQALLAHMNEGEGAQWERPGTSRAQREQQREREQQQQQVRRTAAPGSMDERRSDCGPMPPCRRTPIRRRCSSSWRGAMQRDARRRRDFPGWSGASRDDFAGAGGFGGGNTVRPHNYKKERAAAERAET